VACAESLRVQAYFDGEVDAVSAADIAGHIERCCECRALLQELERTRAALRGHLPEVEAPGELRERIQRALGREAGAAVHGRVWRAQSFWLGVLSGACATVLAAVVVALALATGRSAAVPDIIESAHVRSLISAHLVEVESSDRHTVKPWFAARADVSPIVADFPEAGYRLIGGRADSLLHQRMAVLVYRHGAHVINVFTWVAGRDALPGEITRAGYHLAFWKVGDLQYCAISDTSWEELEGLVRLLRDLSIRDAR
jgi:anti-sigma factor RsiW